MNFSTMETLDNPIRHALQGPNRRFALTKMLELVGRTRPGPFLTRTVELGGYLGVRRNGRILAMAGNRMRLSAFTEISGVCTDVELRGQGVAGSLVERIVAGIVDHGERPFLHATIENTPAIRLYEFLGFTVRDAPRVPRGPASTQLKSNSVSDPRTDPDGRAKI